MARNVTTLKNELKQAFLDNYNETSDAQQGQFEAIAQSIADAIDTYVNEIKTSVDSEDLV